MSAAFGVGKMGHAFHPRQPMMRRLPTGHGGGEAAETDELWSWLDEDRGYPRPDHATVPNWRLVAILLVYGAVLFVVGLLLAG